MRNFLRLSTLLLATTLLPQLLGACAHKPTSGQKADKAPNEIVNVLKQEEASLRAQQISHVNYMLWFGLDETRAEFSGRTAISFDLSGKAKEISPRVFIDFEGGKIQSLTINEKTIATGEFAKFYDGKRIWLDVPSLVVGNNQVKIVYSHPYVDNGNGLHHFKDPVDNQVYLYSNFEPYYANRMFPCFDQPDLKATYEVAVEAPASWQVITNTLPRETSPVEGRKSWKFPRTKAFATYVFALHAGPYAHWDSKGGKAGIPTRLFARQSMAKYVDSKEWLDITNRGLAFYNDLFGFSYPFGKYDQLVVPDFNWGAMENIGAVTFSERYIYRSKATENQHRGRAETILHEMAHMWFGDLVTMKWWNGLWLNESFATLASSLATEGATPFKGSWISFFGEKTWGYWEDQLVTTHPIDLPVANTDEAESNFDGITYGKGASVLKQLRFWLTEQTFRQGLKKYFETNAYGNTTLDDFMGTLAEVSHKDLKTWEKKWILTPSLNRVEAVWACGEDHKISRFTLRQEGSESIAELRPHRTRVGFFTQSKANSPLKLSKAIDVAYSDAKTSVQEAIGLPCPALVFPNYEDQDYVKMTLDPVSLKSARTAVGDFESPFMRQLLWYSLWDMTHDAKISAQEFLDGVMNQLSKEQNILVLSTVLDYANRPSMHRDSAMKYLAVDIRPDYQTKFEKFLQAGLKAAKPGSDLQLIWFKAFLAGAYSKPMLDYVESIFDGKTLLKGLKIDQERRWELIGSLARRGAFGSLKRIQEEVKRDNTDSGQKAAASAEASLPNIEMKTLWMTRIHRKATAPEDKNMKMALLREAMGSFQILGQDELSQDMGDIYFEDLPRVVKETDEDYFRRFAGSMFPQVCDSRNPGRVDAMLKAHPEFPASVVKDLKVGKQEEQECVRAREKSKAASTETGFAKR